MLSLSDSPEVLVFGGYDIARHGRAEVLIEGLTQSSLRVHAISKPVRPSPYRLLRMRRGALPAFMAAGGLSRQAAELAFAARSMRCPRVLLVPHPGFFAAPLARRLFGSGALIILDYLTGLSETLDDHGYREGWAIEMARRMDSAALRSSDVILVDTPEHLALLPSPIRSRGLVVPVGVTERWFGNIVPGDVPPNEPLKVLHYGSCAPMHGVRTIMKAAELTGTRVVYTIVGPLSAEDRRLLGSLRGRSVVKIRDWIDREELLLLSASHEVILGIFGSSAKARRVVPTKLYQAAAQGHAIVTSDSPPQRRLFGRSARYVPAGQPAALADVLLGLSRDRDQVVKMGQEARETVEPYIAQRLVGPLVERINERFSGRVVVP